MVDDTMKQFERVKFDRFRCADGCEIFNNTHVQGVVKTINPSLDMIIFTRSLPRLRSAKGESVYQ